MEEFLQVARRRTPGPPGELFLATSMVAISAYYVLISKQVPYLEKNIYYFHYIYIICHNMLGGYTINIYLTETVFQTLVVLIREINTSIFIR